MKKKLLIIFLLFIILVFTFTTNTFASCEFDFSFADIGLDLPDVHVVSTNISSPEYLLLYYNNTKDHYIFWVSEYPFCFSNVINSGKYFYIGVNEGYFCEYLLKNGTWVRNRDNSAPYSTGGYWAAPEYALYSNYDVYYNDEILVYAYVNPTSPLVQSISSIDTMDTVTSEIVSILPVTLTIVVGLIGIRKAISFTRNKFAKRRKGKI